MAAAPAEVCLIRSILLLQVSQVLGRILYLGFSFYYINKAFGVEGKGLWASLFALFGILSAIANLGFEVWLTREVAGGTVARREGMAFMWKAKGSLWLVALSLGLVWTYVDAYPPLMALAFGVALIADGVGVAEQAIFEGRSLAGQIAWMSFLKSGGFALLAIPLALLAPTDLTPFAWLFAAVLIGRAIYGWRAWRLIPTTATRSDSRRPWREFALMGSFTLVTVVYFKIDVLMLSFLLDRTAAGYYDNAYQFVEGALFISAAAGTVLYPKLVQAPEARRGQLFDGMFQMILALGMCGALALVLIGPVLGRLLIGSDFDGSLKALTVLAFSLPIMFGNGLLSRWLFATHAERFALMCSSSAAIFNLIINAFAIPRYGPSGAAMATVLTEGLLMVLWLLLGRRNMRLFLWTSACFGLLGLSHLLMDSYPIMVPTLGLIGFSAVLLVNAIQFHRISHEPPEPVSPAP